MTRWLLIALLVSWTVVLNGQPGPYLLATGRFGSTDQTLDACRFDIGAAVITFELGGEPCLIATELIGQKGKLVFVVDEDQGGR